MIDRDDIRKDLDASTPYASKAETEAGKPDQLGKRTRDAESRQEALVDEGVEETFPASDPVSVKRVS